MRDRVEGGEREGERLPGRRPRRHDDALAGRGRHPGRRLVRVQLRDAAPCERLDDGPVQLRRKGLRPAPARRLDSAVGHLDRVVEQSVPGLRRGQPGNSEGRNPAHVRLSAATRPFSTVA